MQLLAEKEIGPAPTLAVETPTLAGEPSVTVAAYPDQKEVMEASVGMMGETAEDHHVAEVDSGVFIDLSKINF